MHNVHHAIDALRGRTKLKDFALGSDGRATLVFDGKLPVEFRAVDDRHLELLAPVDDVEADVSNDTLLRLLGANYLGEATGFARLAVEPNGARIVLCERLDVGALDEAGLEQRVLAFVKYVAFWHSGAMDSALDASAASSEATIEDFMIIRG